MFLALFVFKANTFSLAKSSQREGSFFLTSRLLNSLPSKTKSDFYSPYFSSPDSFSNVSGEPSLAQESQFLFSAPPFLVKGQPLASLNSFEKEEKREIFEYEVKEGDTLSGIATSFDISLQTLLWANDLEKNSYVRPGQKLIILPVSGTYHMVKSGETVSGIAKAYGGDLEEIVAFNQLLQEDDISIGDLLIIPGGEPPKKAVSVVVAAASTPLASSYFIAPVPSPYRITQGLHWYNAVDFSRAGNACGTPVFATAGGEVLRTKFGYNSGAGNYIHILHPNGVVTHYGHLESILVVPGQKVSQGEMIGLVGNSGYTIPAGPQGCHLHFEVRGARNPFAG